MIPVGMYICVTTTECVQGYSVYLKVYLKLVKPE